VSRNLRDVTGLWRFNERSDGNFDVAVTNETANIAVSNRSNNVFLFSICKNMVLQNTPIIYTHPVLLEANEDEIKLLRVCV
jgi:hypothetical protein